MTFEEYLEIFPQSDWEEYCDNYVNCEFDPFE